MALFVKSTCVVLAMIVIMFIYSWKLTIYALILISPSMFGTRIFFYFFMESNEKYQTAKADLGSIAQETFGNVRTVKAFANEVQSVD